MLMWKAELDGAAVAEDSWRPCPVCKQPVVKDQIITPHWKYIWRHVDCGMPFRQPPQWFDPPEIPEELLPGW
jgi:hypothetical protein